MCAYRVGSGHAGKSSPAVCGERRNLPIGRIDDERRSILNLSFDHRRDAAGRTGVPVAVGIRQEGKKIIISAGEVGVRVHVEQARGALLELGNFLIREERPTFQLLRTLQWRGAVVPPGSLKIRLAVRSERGSPRFRLA